MFFKIISSLCQQRNWTRKYICFLLFVSVSVIKTVEFPFTTWAQVFHYLNHAVAVKAFMANSIHPKMPEQPYVIQVKFLLGLMRTSLFYYIPLYRCVCVKLFCTTPAVSKCTAFFLLLSTVSLLSHITIRV